MATLERGFPVRLIGTLDKLVTCRVEDRVDEVVDRADAQDFDHLPVTADGNKIVGLLNRGALVADARGSAAQVREVFDPLDETNIIAADAGILVFLLNAKERPCRLILAGDQIKGIVSKSDLQKLPVRALLFHMVTHLELLMAAWIRQHCPDESSWLAMLSDKRRKCVEKRYEKLTESNLAIDRLTATLFADKRAILLEFGSFSSRRKAKKEFERIEELRNSLAHSGDYALTEKDADRLIETVDMTQSWIESLPKLPERSKT